MMDIRRLKELVRLMVNNELTELDLRDSDEQVTLRRQSPNAVPTIVTAPVQPAPAPAPVAAAAAAPGASNGQPPAAAEAPVDDGLAVIESPIVGTFYTSANPDSPAFASVGTSVSADTTVCIVEAMKIFNEIKAEMAGTIEQVLVKNGESVEFGQPLFKVRPA